MRCGWRETMTGNYDSRTVDGFGDEWRRFDQSAVSPSELRQQFERYFKVFPLDTLSANAVGFDMGCGSGRWATLVAPRAGKLICIDPSPAALDVAKHNLRHQPNCEFRLASVDNIPLDNDSMDFGYCLGVLHHVPDTAAGLKACVDKLKAGAPFLVYLYYAFDNRPRWFRLLWRISDGLRRLISTLPFRLRYVVTQVIALLIYYPLANFARVIETLGRDVSAFPLSAYRQSSFYVMRTDALDRFGTRLEKRFTARQIKAMMDKAGLERIEFSDAVPYWCAVGYKKR